MATHSIETILGPGTCFSVEQLDRGPSIMTTTLAGGTALAAICLPDPTRSTALKRSGFLSHSTPSGEYPGGAISSYIDEMRLNGYRLGPSVIVTPSHNNEPGGLAQFPWTESYRSTLLGLELAFDEPRILTYLPLPRGANPIVTVALSTNRRKSRIDVKRPRRSGGNITLKA